MYRFTLRFKIRHDRDVMHKLSRLSTVVEGRGGHITYDINSKPWWRVWIQHNDSYEVDRILSILKDMDYDISPYVWNNHTLLKEGGIWL